MKDVLLKKYCDLYFERMSTNQVTQEKLASVVKRSNEFQAWFKNIDEKTVMDFHAIFGQFFAMRRWGDKVLTVNIRINSAGGIKNMKQGLKKLLNPAENLAKRWDEFNTIKSISRAFISETLCLYDPEKYLIWSSLSTKAFEQLDIKVKRRVSEGEKYAWLCEQGKEICHEIQNYTNRKRMNFLELDCFLSDTVNKRLVDEIDGVEEVEEEVDERSKISGVSVRVGKSLHNEMKEKVEEIGKWLGFDTKTEMKVVEGSVVDVVWESAVHLGRTIYVFEVQHKGSLDSLFVNLTRAKSNPAVQGVVAVSKEDQVSEIKRKTTGLRDLNDLKTWSFDSVASIHSHLEESQRRLEESQRHKGEAQRQIDELNFFPRGFIGSKIR